MKKIGEKQYIPIRYIQLKAKNSEYAFVWERKDKKWILIKKDLTITDRTPENIYECDTIIMDPIPTTVYPLGEYECVEVNFYIEKIMLLIN